MGSFQYVVNKASCGASGSIGFVILERYIFQLLVELQINGYMDKSLICKKEGKGEKGMEIKRMYDMVNRKKKH